MSSLHTYLPAAELHLKTLTRVSVIYSWLFVPLCRAPSAPLELQVSLVHLVPR